MLSWSDEKTGIEKKGNSLNIKWPSRGVSPSHKTAGLLSQRCRTSCTIAAKSVMCARNCYQGYRSRYELKSVPCPVAMVVRVKQATCRSINFRSRRWKRCIITLLCVLQLSPRSFIADCASIKSRRTVVSEPSCDIDIFERIALLR